jgi:hypothetical protein
MLTVREKKSSNQDSIMAKKILNEDYTIRVNTKLAISATERASMNIAKHHKAQHPIRGERRSELRSAILKSFFTEVWKGDMQDVR